jgi:hypothetical protein
LGYRGIGVPTLPPVRTDGPKTCRRLGRS